MANNIEIVDLEKIYTDKDREEVEGMREPRGWVYAIRRELLRGTQDVLSAAVSMKIAEQDKTFSDYVNVNNSIGPKGATLGVPRSLFYAGVIHWSQDPEYSDLVCLVHQVNPGTEIWFLSRKEQVLTD